ncbi:MAG: hypothetical protein KJO18_03080, partial [Acidimicrobiia bacterium]|nr:hypothetical protein [Acidimicrobiia bacterium]
MSTQTETATVYAPDRAWEAAPTFPGTAEAKILRDEGAGKARTALIRLNAWRSCDAACSPRHRAALRRRRRV